MTKKSILLLLSALLFIISINKIIAQDKFFTKSGSVSFFSYTLVEDIKADNNQVLSIINTGNGKIVIKMLMRSFHFKKALMQEHFNENYIESYKFPKAIFKGVIKNFSKLEKKDVAKIEGILTIRGVSKKISTVAKITQSNRKIILKGKFKVRVADFDIRIPTVVSKNISKTIIISFELNHKLYK